MIHVVLTNGKRITYNRGGTFDTAGNLLFIREKAEDKKKGYCFAVITLSLIERLEWEPPCQIKKERVK